MPGRLFLFSRITTSSACMYVGTMYWDGQNGGESKDSSKSPTTMGFLMAEQYSIRLAPSVIAAWVLGGLRRRFPTTTLTATSRRPPTLLQSPLPLQLQIKSRRQIATTMVVADDDDDRRGLILTTTTMTKTTRMSRHKDEDNNQGGGWISNNMTTKMTTTRKTTKHNSQPCGWMHFRLRGVGWFRHERWLKDEWTTIN